MCAVGFLVGLVAWIVCWRIFLILCCFLLPIVCCGSVCIEGSSGTGGMDCVLEDVSNTMLFSLALCVAAVCAVGILVGLVAWIVCWRIFLILCCFLLPIVCCGSVCIEGSSGTGGMDCVLEDVSNTMLFSLALCVAAVCAVGILVGLVAWILCWRIFLILCCFLLPIVCCGSVCIEASSGTGGKGCVLEDGSNFLLFSVA